MSDRPSRNNKQFAAASTAQKGKAKEAADIGNSDIGSEESAKAETPIDPHTTFSAGQMRYIGNSIGVATALMRQDISDDLNDRIHGIDQRLDEYNEQMAQLQDNINTIINMLAKKNVEDRDLQENGRMRIPSNANIRSPAAGAGDNQDRPFSPANQRPSVPVDTPAQGMPATKQDPYLQIPEPPFQQNQYYRDDFRRSPSPYARSNTLPPNFGGNTVRWRPEDLGYFHGQKDDVHTWVDRIRELAALKGSPIVQANLSLSLREEAENWYHHELTKAQKDELLDPASGIEPWIAALTHRFEMDPVEILAKLNKQRYTRADAAAGKDPIEHLHTVMKLTRNRSTAESLYEAYMRIDSMWQLSLVAPTSSTTIEDFVKQLNAKKAAWQSEARRMDSYGNKPFNQSNGRQPAAGDSRNNNGSGNRWQGYQRNEKQSSRNDHPRDHFRQPAPNPGDVGPRVYHAGLVPLLPPPGGGEEDEDVNDPDVWHADAGYGHGCSAPECQHWHGNH